MEIAATDLLVVILGALWPVIGAGVWFAIARLTGAIDRLTDKAGAHDVRLARLETKIQMEA